MIWIVDGYNVIFSDKILTKLVRGNNETGRQELIRRILQSTEFKGDKVVVVFDGKYGPSNEKPAANVYVRFSPARETADDMIKREIAQSTRRRSLRIVSSDTSIADFARECGAVALDSSDFLSLLKRPANRREHDSGMGSEKPNVGTALDTELLKLFNGEK